MTPSRSTITCIAMTLQQLDTLRTSAAVSAEYDAEAWFSDTDAAQTELRGIELEDAMFLHGKLEAFMEVFEAVGVCELCAMCDIDINKLGDYR